VISQRKEVKCVVGITTIIFRGGGEEEEKNTAPREYEKVIVVNGLDHLSDFGENLDENVFDGTPFPVEVLFAHGAK